MYKQVQLKTFSFYKSSRRWSLLDIFLKSGPRWRRKHCILAQTISTISLVIVGGCVRLFFAESFIYIYLDWFFFLIDGVSSYC